MALKSADAYRSLLSEPNVQRALETIKAAEGTARASDPYSVGFGFTTLPDLESHPGQSLSRSFTAKGRRNSSSAAGAYQFMDRTWSEMAPQLGLEDFSRESQDIAALAKIDQRGGLDNVLKGDFRGFAKAVGKEWASFPDNNYGQKKYSKDQLETFWDDGLKPAAKGLPPGSRMLTETPPNFRGVTMPPAIDTVPTPQLATRGLNAPVQPVERMALGPLPGEVRNAPVPTMALREKAVPTGAARAVQGLAAGVPTPAPAPRPSLPQMPAPSVPTPMPAPRQQAPQMAMPARPVSRTPEWGAPKQTAPAPQTASLPQSVMDRMAGFPQGLPQRAAPLPDAVSYGLMAESMKSRGVMGLDGRMAADQPRSLPTRAPSVPTPTFMAERPAMPTPTPAPREQVARSVPAPTFADRLEKTAATLSPARSNFAGPAGSFRSMQAPSEMAEIGSRVAPVSVAERMGLPNAPTPTAAPRGMMSRIGDAIASPAQASTMPGLSPTVDDRMGGFAPTQAVDMSGYRTASLAPTAPREAPTRQMTSPRAMESLGAPSLDNFAMPRSRPSVATTTAPMSVAPARAPAPAPTATAAPAPAPAAPPATRSDARAPARSAVSSADPVSVAERATRTAMQPEAQPSFAERAFGSLGGLGGVAGSIIGGAVAGPMGMVAGNLVGRQISRPTAQVSTGGNHGTGTRSSAANAALNAGWSGFGPMTAAQERAARNAGSGSSYSGGGGWGNQASSSAIGGRTTSYSDGSTERSSSKSKK